MSVFFPNGMGEATGDDIVTANPAQVSGDIWFVQSTTGTDAVSPAGKDKQKPLATFAQALANSASGDTVCFLQNHTETYTAAVTINKRLLLVGAGSTAGVPTVRFLANAAAAGIFNITAANVQIRNIYFPTNTQSNTVARVTIAATDFELHGCYFECGALDQAAAVLHTAGAHLYLDSNTWLSTATTTATRPTRGFQSSATVSPILLKGNVFDDGAVGFSTAACDFGSNLTDLTIENISLLRGADVVNIGTGYRVFGITSTDGGRIS